MSSLVVKQKYKVKNVSQTKGVCEKDSSLAESVRQWKLLSYDSLAYQISTRSFF